VCARIHTGGGRPGLQSAEDPGLLGRPESEGRTGWGRSGRSVASGGLRAPPAVRRRLGSRPRRQPGPGHPPQARLAGGNSVAKTRPSPATPGPRRRPPATLATGRPREVPTGAAGRPAWHARPPRVRSTRLRSPHRYTTTRVLPRSHRRAQPERRRSAIERARAGLQTVEGGHGSPLGWPRPGVGTPTPSAHPRRGAGAGRGPGRDSRVGANQDEDIELARAVL
jgi:hypothetical protein